MKHKIYRSLAAGLGTAMMLGAMGVPVMAAGKTAAAAGKTGVQAVSTPAAPDADGNRADGSALSSGLEISGEQILGLPNPFQDFTTLAAAQNCAGFELKLPLVVPDGYKDPVYRAIPGEFLEVVWKNDAGEDFRYRKCLAEYGDASGDYNDYAVNQTVRIGNVDLRLRGSQKETDPQASTSASPAAASAQASAADATSSKKREAGQSEANKAAAKKSAAADSSAAADTLVHVISGVASDGYSYAMTSTAGLDAAQLEKLRLGFIEEWLPVALRGETAETAQNLMSTFSTRLYDTGISLMYRDDRNPDYFYYIPLDEDRKVVTVSYQKNETMTIQAETGAQNSQNSSAKPAAASKPAAGAGSGNASQTLEQSMTGNFLDRIRGRQ